MATLKTQPTGQSVSACIDAIPDEPLRADCRTVAAMMTRVTGCEPELWRGGLIGFGRHRYDNARGDGVDWMEVSLAPRKGHFTVYVMPGFAGYDRLLGSLGRCRHGKSCIHIKRLSDVDLPTLETLMTESVRHLRRGRRRPAGKP